MFLQVDGLIWPEDPLPTPSTPCEPTRRKRHSWAKVKVHCYICRDCALCRVNTQDRTGGWSIKWHLPDGSRVTSLHAPPCEPGPATAKRLQHYASAIACDPGPKARRAAAAGE